MRVLLGKELLELRRTFRVIVLPALFVVFGLAAPALIRALPMIIKGSEAQGLDIPLPDFGPADGIAQYLSFARQLGLIAVIVLYMGIIAGERKEGTLAMLFVKPVSRLSFVWTRWVVNGAYLGLSFLAGCGTAVLYTVLLLGRPDFSAAAAAAGLYLAYLLLAFSWTTLFSALTKNPGIAAGLSIVPLFVVPVLGALWKPLGEYGPYGAVAAGTAAVGAVGSPSVSVPLSAFFSVGLDLFLSAALVFAAYWALRRAEL